MAIFFLSQNRRHQSITRNFFALVKVSFFVLEYLRRELENVFFSTVDRNFSGLNPLSLLSCLKNTNLFRNNNKETPMYYTHLLGGSEKVFFSGFGRGERWKRHCLKMRFQNRVFRHVKSLRCRDFELRSDIAFFCFSENLFPQAYQ